MRGVCAQRVIAVQLRHHINAGEAVQVNRNPGHFLIAQIEHQRHTLEATLLFQPGTKLADVTLIQRHDHGQLFYQCLQVLHLFRHNLQAERWTVICQQYSVMAEDQSTGRGNRHDLDPVGLREGAVMVMQYNLQVKHAAQDREKT